jgi:hypothetical protein
VFRSTYWPLSCSLSHQNPICVPLICHWCYMPCSSYPPWHDNSKLYLAKSTSYEAPLYAVFSNLLSLHLSLVKIFSLALCSQRPSIHVPPLMSETKFRTHTNRRQKFLIFTYLDSGQEDNRFWTEW